jgi:hypothetical protein
MDVNEHGRLSNITLKTLFHNQLKELVQLELIKRNV